MVWCCNGCWYLLKLYIAYGEMMGVKRPIQIRACIGLADCMDKVTICIYNYNIYPYFLQLF